MNISGLLFGFACLLAGNYFLFDKPLSAGWLIFIVVYSLPSSIACLRKHPNENSIEVINFFLGWTVLGWVGSLAWSLSAIRRENS